MNDFYSGFEGEPEIRFLLKSSDATSSAVRMWAGYFDSIMAKIEPEEGLWKGLAVPFHLHEGWYEAPWKVVDLDYVAKQWRHVSRKGLDPRCVGAHSAVTELLHAALDGDGEVWILWE